MKKLQIWLGSGRMAIVLLAALGVIVLLRHRDPSVSQWWLIATFLALALSLLAALLTHPRLRHGGLLVFHASLLALVVLACVGQLTRFQARVELTEGNALRDAQLENVEEGALHSGRIGAVDFAQGSFTVQYAPGLKRGQTTSMIRANGEVTLVGDDEAFVTEGYRFYTTHNKGFAPVLSWTYRDGTAIVGAVHMPSYPLFDWKQDQQWQIPGGPELRLWLQLRVPRDDKHGWVLDSGGVDATLVVQVNGQRVELKQQQMLRLPNGTLRFEALRSWMGYKIYFDPTLPWLLAIALVAVAGLAWHVGASLRAEAKSAYRDGVQPVGVH